MKLKKNLTRVLENDEAQLIALEKEKRKNYSDLLMRMNISQDITLIQPACLARISIAYFLAQVASSPRTFINGIILLIEFIKNKHFVIPCIRWN